MKTILAARASAILYNLLSGKDNGRPFLLPVNICPIVPITFFKAGAPFEFIDISARTLNMDLEQAEGRIKTRKYGGLLYAHTYGDPFTPLEFFKEIKKQYADLMVIDDRCLCIPDLVPDPTNMADVILYSTGYAKIVDLDYAGFAFLSEDINYLTHALPYQRSDLEELEKIYKSSIVTGEKYLYKDSNWLQTDLDLPAWPEFAERVRTAKESSIAHRRSVNAVYNLLIPPSLSLGEEYQLWRFNLRLPDKKKTLEALFNAGLFASSHYASLGGIMSPGKFPMAKRLADEVINLFNDIHYTLEMAEKTAKIVLESL
jgi:hypothetical protein